MSDHSLSAALTRKPVLLLFLGACPAMALSANVLSALAVGVAALLVMLLSNLVLWVLRGIIGTGVLAKLVVISCFVSAVQLLMNAFLPSVYPMMGVYLAVLAVSLLLFHEAESADKGGLGAALGGAIVAGLIFTAAVVCMAAVREVFGSASFAGIEIAALKNYTVPLLAQAPGGFVVFAFVLAVLNKLCPAGKRPDGQACEAAGLGAATEE